MIKFIFCTLIVAWIAYYVYNENYERIQTKDKSDDEYDYIIIGAGSTGLYSVTIIF